MTVDGLCLIEVSRLLNSVKVLVSSDFMPCYVDYLSLLIKSMIFSLSEALRLAF